MLTLNQAGAKGEHSPAQDDQTAENAEYTRRFSSLSRSD